MASIYHLSWNEKTFLAKVKLFFASRKREKEKMLSSEPKKQADGYSALSSTYYSIVGTAGVHLKKIVEKWWCYPLIIPWCFTWGPLAWWCYWKMLPLSDRVFVLLGGYDNMSPVQCDIRQSILLRRGSYYHKEAKRCIKAAFEKNPKVPHTRGLLHVGLAYIYTRAGNWPRADEEICLAEKEAGYARSEGEYLQAVRIYRKCAEIAMSDNQPVNGSMFRSLAKETLQQSAVETGRLAEDQRLKARVQ